MLTLRGEVFFGAGSELELWSGVESRVLLAGMVGLAGYIRLLEDEEIARAVVAYQRHVCPCTTGRCVGESCTKRLPSPSPWLQINLA